MTLQELEQRCHEEFMKIVHSTDVHNIKERDIMALGCLTSTLHYLCYLKQHHKATEGTYQPQQHSPQTQQGSHLSAAMGHGG